ncbi:MAG: nuclear transport factor 2 family protein [Myxococcota bacterium]
MTTATIDSAPGKGRPDAFSNVSPFPGKAYAREELEEMKHRWLDANERAEETGDWAAHLGPLYHDDAIYRWNVGPNEEFVARGRQEIEDLAVGVHMDGLKGWTYPYDRFLIDTEKGEMVGFWRQVAPVRRDDGGPLEVAGCGGSWFQYGGDFKWQWQRDFFDFGNVLAVFSEVADKGALTPSIKGRMRQMARGVRLPGQVLIHPRTTVINKVRRTAAIAKILLTGK